MLRILFRIALILAVSGLIAGGLYLYANSTGSDLGSMPGGEERPAFDRGQLPPTGDQGRPIQGGPEGTEGGISFNGWAGVLGQAGKVVLITIVVVGIRAATRRIQRGRRRTRRWPQAPAF